MNRKERFARESHFSTCAKAVSVVFTVGVVAVLMARTPLHLTEASVLPAPTAVEQPDSLAGTVSLTLSAQQSEAAARTAVQDDPPIPTF
jgi:hypothetical protein